MPVMMWTYASYDEWTYWTPVMMSGTMYASYAWEETKILDDRFCVGFSHLGVFFCCCFGCQCSTLAKYSIHASGASS